MAEQMCLMVYRAPNGKYYFTVYSPNNARKLGVLEGGAKAIFTLRGDDFEKLTREARDEARRRGIAYVAELDDPLQRRSGGNGR